MGIKAYFKNGAKIARVVLISAVLLVLNSIFLLREHSDKGKMTVAQAEDYSISEKNINLFTSKMSNFIAREMISPAAK